VVFECLIFSECSFFKECPHPNEKQRLELGKKLTLESKQIKFWFQNRRTQMKVLYLKSYGFDSRVMIFMGMLWFLY